MSLGLSLTTREPLEAPFAASKWDLHVDRSSNGNGCGAGLILSSLEPKHLRIEYMLLLRFKAFNNEVEYEALLAGLRLT